MPVTADEVAFEAVWHLHEAWLAAELSSDIERVLALCTSDVRWLAPGSRMLVGREAGRRLLTDAQAEIESIVASDLQAAAARYARILGIEPDRSPGEALFRLLRGALRLCERAPFEQIYGAALAVPADRFGLVALRVRDLAVAGRALQANRVPYRAAEGAAYVPAVSAAGAALALRRGR